jgi:hypothetical protein
MKKKNFFLFFMCTCLLCSTAFSLDWPVSPGLSGSFVMQKNFGENSGGLLETGDTFLLQQADSDNSVRSAGKGELIFAGSGGDCVDNASASGIPSPLGCWTAIDHGDGLVGIYGRLARGSITPNDLYQGVDSSSVVGTAGRSGAFAGKPADAGFYFSVYDSRERRYVNSALVLTKMQDSIKPVIKNVSLRGEGGQQINLDTMRVASQGLWDVIVTASDTVQTGGPSLAPYRIVVLLNGVENGNLSFATTQTRDGVRSVSRTELSASGTTVNALESAAKICAYPPGWDAATVQLARGMVSMDIIVSDYAGNSTTPSYKLYIE